MQDCKCNFTMPSREQLPDSLRLVDYRWRCAVCRLRSDGRWLGVLMQDVLLLITPLFDTAKELQEYLSEDTVYFYIPMVVKLGRLAC